MKFQIKSKVAAVLLSCAVMATFAIPASAQTMKPFNDGSGTATDPFLITTADELEAIPSMGLNMCYKLQNDIDLSSYGDWMPIGDNTYAFSGTFDGNGHRITGLTIGSPNSKTSTSYLGLFGSTSGATIENVSVNANIYSSGNYIGGLVGQTSGGNITNCSSSVQIIGANYTGGLIGNTTKGGNVAKSSSAGSVSGNTYTGGFVGNNDALTTNNCSSSCNTTSTDNYAGGFAGMNGIKSTVTNCSATGNITGNNYVGGCIGYNNSSEDEWANWYDGTIINSYATGNVTGNSYTGGFLGFDNTNAITQNCYSAGIVTGKTHTGGFLGHEDSATIKNCYWCYSQNHTTRLGYGDYTGSVPDIYGMTYSRMQAKSFSDLLNSNITTLSLKSAYKWNNSSDQNNGLPYLVVPAES